jgi:predicted permease
MFTSIANKLGHLFGRHRFDESFEEEMRLHVDERTAELMARGTPAADARAQARREFGPAARIAEDSRDAWRWTWIEDLARDLRHGIRALARDRGFAAAAIVSLALGIGVNSTIFSLTTEFLFSAPSVRSPETLVNATVGGSTTLPMREYRFLRDAKVFPQLVAANPMQEINWRNGDTSIRLFVTRVTGNYFDVTGAPVALGRPLQEGDRNTVVISHRFWQSQLQADPNVLGRSLSLDGQPYTITGVLPRIHRTLTGFGYMPDLYLAIPPDSNMSGQMFGRLAPGDSRAAALGRLQSAAAQLDLVYPDGNHKWSSGVVVMNLVGIERLTMGFLPTVSAFFGMLMAVVGLLLVIACANVAGLLLARASARTHEFAIRMSIGAGRSRIVRQMLAESLLLAAAGAIAGLGINYLLTRLLNGVSLPMPFPVQLAIQPDSRLLVYAAVLALASALMAGLLPALKSTRTGTSGLLKQDEHQVSGRRAMLRNVLVAGQLSVSVLVLIMAALSIRNLVASSALDPGFDIRHTVWAQVRLVPENYGSGAKVRALVSTALERLRSVPGVSSATTAIFVPLNDHFASRVRNLYGDVVNPGARVEHSWNAVGPDYLATMGIKLVAGREFNSLDREGSQPVVIVNEALARLAFGEANAIGRRLRFGREEDRTVVGVARNSKYSTLGERNRPAVYEPYMQVGWRPGVNILVSAAGPPDALIKPLNDALLQIDPSAAVELKPMNRAMAFALFPSRAAAALLGLVGLLGLILASVGLYGLLAYSISRRTREIGLRLALGGRRSHVLRLVLTQAVWIVVSGLAIGTFLAIFVTRPLARFLVPGITTADPISYATVALALIGVACAASLVPALRALRVDPMTALRYE